MSPTGLIFGVLAVVWLVYLVPLFLNRHENGLMDEVEPGEPFSATVTIVRRGTPLDSAESGTAVVSTPLNRRAALRELREIDASAARRRRRVLGTLLLIAASLGGFAWAGYASWWSVLVPLGLVAVFLVIARHSVAAMRRDLDARAQVIRGGDAVNEDTVAIAVLEESTDENEVSVELDAPVESASSLWDPIPVPAQTYVSRPLAPRTVRTIDLSAPVPVGAGVPVTADPIEAEPEASGPEDLPRAVGE